MGEPVPNNVDPTPTPAAAAPEIEVVELDADGTVARLLTLDDDDSIAELAVWLKANAKAWAPVVKKAVDDPKGISAEAACAVLEALAWRAPADEVTTLGVMEACLHTIAVRITESLQTGESNEHDDALVGSAVSIVTANRRSKLAETAIACLAQEGLGGALVLARAFDAVRSSSKFYIVQRLDPATVLALGDNVVVSLSKSVAKLAEELEGKQERTALEFITKLGPVEPMESSEIDPAEPLEVGHRVFHATWGAGAVLAASDESVTVDFGGAGQRTLLRAFAKLRHAE